MNKEIKDPIRPNHYLGQTNNDVIKFCMDNKLGYMEGNIVRYVVRHDKKNGLEDLKKAQEYIRRLIEREESKISEDHNKKTTEKYEEDLEALANINIPTPGDILKFNKMLRRDEIDAMLLAFANTPTQVLSDDNEYCSARLYCPDCGGRIKIRKTEKTELDRATVFKELYTIFERNPEQPTCSKCGREYVIRFDKYNLEMCIIPDPRK